MAIWALMGLVRDRIETVMDLDMLYISEGVHGFPVWLLVHDGMDYVGCACRQSSVELDRCEAQSERSDMQTYAYVTSLIR
jgi:hypothetical protein